MKRYEARLRTAGIPIEKLIVFGSYAKGSAKTWSDVDVCVVSHRVAFEMVWWFVFGELRRSRMLGEGILVAPILIKAPPVFQALKSWLWY